jgi:ubiquinone/menaquinone biosynthesis C-methylase UbiE
MIITDYNKIAPIYNERYTDNYLLNIENEIKQLILLNKHKNLLEAGCGTGRWISSLDNKNNKVFGLDFSFEMLKVSNHSKLNLNVVNADAVNIPFKDNLFDLIFCVNAVHHFQDKIKFIRECKRTLNPNGTLAVFGVDPHIDKDWYVYDYFDSVYENDLKRFPSLEYLRRLLGGERFENIEFKTVEVIYKEMLGKEIFLDPFLEKHNTSQLANLSEEEYEKGIEKIKKQIEQNPETVFKTSVIFYLVSAKKNKE